MWIPTEGISRQASSTVDVERPHVSVLMTVYNGESTLVAALDSLLAQDFDFPYEIVVVNDGSTDDTSMVLRSYELRGANIRVYNAGRIGRARALNVGLSHCRAPYVAINDCDDLSHPHRLRKQAEFLDRNPQVVLVAGWARVVDDSGFEIEQRCIVNDDRVLRRRLAIGNPFIHSTVMFRKEVLERLEGFNESQVAAIDYDAIERMARVGKLGYVEDFILTHYRGERQYFRARLGSSVRWRVAGRIALRAAFRHAWWMLPISGLVFLATWMPGADFAKDKLRRIHARLVGRSTRMMEIGQRQ